MIRFFAIALFALSCVARADDFVVPALTGPVVDQAGILSADASSTLERGIRRLNSETGTQITVLTVASLGGLEIEQASIKVTDAWKLGTAKDDKGVLLIVAPNERRVRIEVGQGLEGSLTDAFSNRIIRDVITPRFRTGDYSGGVIQGVAAIVHYTNPDVDLQTLFGADGSPARARGNDRGGLDLNTIFWIAFFVIIVLSSLFRGGRGGGGGRGSNIAAAALGYGLGRSSGGWGGGGGWGGSGGGGGWSGGGGGFSGGGASGGW